MNNIQKILLISMILCSFSQSIASSEFGVKMGMVSSKFELKTLSGDHISHETYFDQNRIGPTMGIYYRVFDFKIINFESELYYLQKGGQEEVAITTVGQPEGTGEYIIGDIQFDYLQLQVNMRPNYIIKKLDLYGIIGISLNYLLSVKNGIRSKDSFKNFSFSYSIGAGIELNDLLNHSLLLEFLISSDITNIYKDSNPEYKFQTYIIRFGFGIIQ